MEIVLLIALLEGLALVAWLLIRHRPLEQLVPVSVGLPPRSLPSTTKSLLRKGEAAQWAFVNESQAAGQANDRRPIVYNSVAAVGQSAARRSSARRSHHLS